jgi:trk system potassium uptake protein TrkA
MKIVIVGAGEIGFHFAEWLSFEKKEVVIIDINDEALKGVRDYLDVQTLFGSGSNPAILEEAGIEEADILLAVTGSDEVNLIACFFTNILSPSTHKVALIRNRDYAEYRGELAKNINLSMVINPELEVVKSILRIISAPDVEEINDFMGGRLKMLGKHLTPESQLDGLKLMNLSDKIEKHKMIIAALIRDDRLIIPKGKDTLRAGDLVYFVCENKYLDEILKLFGPQSRGLKNILIVGGGNIGFALARELENTRYNVKLIEKDPKRCQIISAKLHRSIVLQGLATDQKFLEQENIGAMDMIIALTWDEEINILSCLLAKRLGAKKTIARVNKFSYIPLVHSIGIDHIVSPRLSAINSIFPYIHRGQVISMVSIRGKEAEVLEAIAMPNSEIVGVPLKSLKFLKEALILYILRGEKFLIPAGDTVVNPDDRIIILSKGENVPFIEQALMLKR